jgi:hypothetical protein
LAEVTAGDMHATGGMFSAIPREIEERTILTPTTCEPTEEGAHGENQTAAGRFALVFAAFPISSAVSAEPRRELFLPCKLRCERRGAEGKRIADGHRLALPKNDGSHAGQHGMELAEKQLAGMRESFGAAIEYLGRNAAKDVSCKRSLRHEEARRCWATETRRHSRSDRAAVQLDGLVKDNRDADDARTESASLLLIHSPNAL